MKISIFPSAKAIPENKEEKKRESFKCSSPHKPSVIEVNSHEEVMNVLLHNAWSPSIFSGVRNNGNFISTDFLTLDVDEDLTIEEASKRCMELDLDHIIMTTPSHSPKCDRFRLIIPLSRQITNQDVFESTWNYLYEIFPESDAACKDLARFYFGGREVDSFYYDEGNLLEPIFPKEKKVIDMHNQRLISTYKFENKSCLEILYNSVPSRLPECIHYFLSNAHTGLQGEWNNLLNACVFTLALQDIQIDMIILALESVAPSDLDEKDIYTIKRAFKQGTEARIETSAKYASSAKNRHLI